MLVGALICLSSAATLIGDALFGTREGKVHEYEQTISNWTMYRAELLRSNFSVRVRINDHLRPTVAVLPKDESEETAALTEDDQGASDLPDYVPIRFWLDSNPHKLLPTLNYTMSPDENAIFEFSASYRPKADGETVTTVLSTLSIPLWTKKVVPGATPVPARKCPDQQHGTWVRNRCEIYRRLSAMCVLVDLDEETGQYHLQPQRNKDSNSYGCERSSSSMSDNVRWNPATYSLVRVTASEKAGVVSYVFPETTLDDVSITVRSTHDPLIEAEKVTKGSLDFGMTAHNSIILGSVLFVLAICLAGSPVLAMRQSYKEIYGSDALPSYSSVSRSEYDSDEASDDSHESVPNHSDDSPVASNEIELTSQTSLPVTSSSGMSRTLPRRPLRSSE